MKYLCAIGLLFCVFLLHAQDQTPSVISGAPVPHPLAEAKTAFISNPGPIFWYFNDEPNRAYNQFYAALKTMGRFELVDDPSKADLVFELRKTPNDSLQLTVYDRKSHYVLWTLIRSISSSSLKKSCLRNFDVATESLIRDLKELSRQSSTQTVP